MASHGSRGESSRREFSHGLARRGSRGLARRGEVQYVAADRGMAGHVKAVEARSEAAKHGLVRQSGCVESRFGMARCGRAVMARFVFVWRGVAVAVCQGIVTRGKSGRGMARSGSHGMEYQYIRKEAQCRHLQTSIHIARDSISKSLHR